MAENMLENINGGTLALALGDSGFKMPDIPGGKILLESFLLYDTYYCKRNWKKDMVINPGEQLKLYHDTDRKNEPYRVQVCTLNEVEVGTVPMQLARITANLLDAGKELYLEVKRADLSMGTPEIEVDMLMKN